MACNLPATIHRFRCPTVVLGSGLGYRSFLPVARSTARGMLSGAAPCSGRPPGLRAFIAVCDGCVRTTGPADFPRRVTVRGASVAGSRRDPEVCLLREAHDVHSAARPVLLCFMQSLRGSAVPIFSHPAGRRLDSSNFRDDAPWSRLRWGGERRQAQGPTPTTPQTIPPATPSAAPGPSAAATASGLSGETRAAPILHSCRAKPAKCIHQYGRYVAFPAVVTSKNLEPGPKK